MNNKPSFLAIILPGILIAATGIGAGDLATASFSGSQLGLAILWAVVLGGLFKYFLTEGLARWQLVTGTTLLQGVSQHFGRVSGWLFLPYLLLWSFFVASALMSACGVTLHAIFPVFDDPVSAKIFFGIFCSLGGLSMVWFGGYKLFEKVMAICIGIMFFTVLITAALLWPSTSEIFAGLFIPGIPDAQGAGITWTVALIGGVGGTVTILCYGYWIREKGRNSTQHITISRIDLTTGYAITILFGLAMVIIGSTIKIEGSGAGLLVTLADRLQQPLGLWGRWLFLLGAFGAVFSSLLGVWQAVPYLFADLWKLFFSRNNPSKNIDLTKTKPYKYFMIAIALIPMAGLLISFKEVQKLYAVTGSLFIPLLALALLILNGRKKWLNEHTNKPHTVIILLATLIFFCSVAFLKWWG